MVEHRDHRLAFPADRSLFQFRSHRWADVVGVSWLEVEPTRRDVLISAWLRVGGDHRDVGLGPFRISPTPLASRGVRGTLLLEMPSRFRHRA